MSKLVTWSLTVHLAFCWQKSYL